VDDIASILPAQYDPAAAPKVYRPHDCECTGLRGVGGLLTEIEWFEAYIVRNGRSLGPDVLWCFSYFCGRGRTITLKPARGIKTLKHARPIETLKPTARVPEGNQILKKLTEIVDDLVDADDQMTPVVFRHRSHRWFESHQQQVASWAAPIQNNAPAAVLYRTPACVDEQAALRYVWIDWKEPLWLFAIREVWLSQCW
jgi:hypothetical protein